MRKFILVAFVATACTPASEHSTSTGTEESTTRGPASDTGASTSSVADTSTGAIAGYHPEGFAAAEVHGPELKLHTQDCRACHGNDLKGGSAEVSCDSCHEPEWRTDCVYCHGGSENATGAPPRDIDGTADAALISFIAHPRHTSIFQHAAYDCDQCHRKPIDVLSEGHIFDDTDEVAEIDFSAGLSPDAVWDGAGGCSSLYCHGNGLVADGTYEHDQPTPSCGGCHPFPASENTAFATMSGEHARHTSEGIGCPECHDPVAIDRHVDGAKDVRIDVAGFTFDAAATRCSGLCHLKLHSSEGW